MLSMLRLSIIIPMYNVEPYIERCLSSLQDQDIPMEEYEIICINDGSPDNSREVVIRFQRQNKNIILIDQSNQGVSKARNNGINVARGKYLLFVDPDDYIIPNSLNSRLVNAEDKSAQVSVLGFTFLDKDGLILKEIFSEAYTSEVYRGTEAYFLARGDGRTDPDRTWAILFDKGFITHYNLLFLSDMPYLEDGEFIARVFCLANRCIFDGASFYMRTTRPGSATNSSLFHSSPAALGLMRSVIGLKAFQKSLNLSQEQKRFLNQPICKFVLLALKSGFKFPYWRNYKKMIAKLHAHELNKLDLTGVVKPYNYFGYLYNNYRLVFLLNLVFHETKVTLKKVLGK